MDGHTAASIGTDSVVRLWDVSLGIEKQKFILGSGSEPAKALVVGRQDHNLMCCGNLEGCVSIYDIREVSIISVISFCWARAVTFF